MLGFDLTRHQARAAAARRQETARKDAARASQANAAAAWAAAAGRSSSSRGGAEPKDDANVNAAGLPVRVLLRGLRGPTAALNGQQGSLAAHDGITRTFTVHIDRGGSSKAQVRARAK